jgi:hypothetical protein
MGGPARLALGVLVILAEPAGVLPRPGVMHRTHAPLLALTMLLAGCSFLAVPAPSGGVNGGGSDADPGAGGKPIGGGGGIVIPAPNDGAQRQIPDPTVIDARPVAVDHYVIGPDGRTVVVYYWGGNQACFGLHSVQVELRDGVPVITVMEGGRAGGPEVCTMEALLKSAVVTLEAPILSDAAGGAAAGEPQLPAQPQAAQPVAGVLDPRPHAITGYALAADGVSLSVYYVGGTEACYALAEASAQAQPDGVLVVSIKEGTLPNAGACDDIGVAKAVTITLDEPLLLDGAT